MATQTITISIGTDKTVEPNETFFVNLSNPTGGATISDNQAVVTITNDDGTPVEASAAAPTDAPTAAELTAAQLDEVVEQAKSAWIAVKADADFTGLSISIADLVGLELGITAAKQVTIDGTAGGWGWTVSGGKMDLLTVVLHELGHVLGLEHAGEDTLMGETLAPGETHGAEAPQASSASAAPAATAAAAAASWTISLANGADHTVTISLGADGLGVAVDGVTETRTSSGVLDLTITGGDGADTFTLAGSLFPLVAAITIRGGAGRDTIRGPPANTIWNIDGVGSGNVAGVAFAEIEDVAGAADNEDTFVLEAQGSISGTVDGGAGGYDTLIVRSSAASSIASTSVDGNSGTVVVDGRTIVYTGLEPVLIDSGTAGNAEFTLTTGDDEAVLEDGGVGQLRIHSVNGTFEDTTFTTPAGSLTINLGAGDDKLTISAITGFTGTLTIHGGADDDTYIVQPGFQSFTLGSPDAGTDTIDLSAISTAITVSPDRTTITSGTSVITQSGDLAEEIDVALAAGTGTAVNSTLDLLTSFAQKVSAGVAELNNVLSLLDANDNDSGALKDLADLANGISTFVTAAKALVSGGPPLANLSDLVAKLNGFAAAIRFFCRPPTIATGDGATRIIDRPSEKALEKGADPLNQPVGVNRVAELVIDGISHRRVFPRTAAAEEEVDGGTVEKALR